MKRSATSRRMQALSGVGWSAALLGLLLMAAALLDASAALFGVALFLVFVGRTLAIAAQGSSRTGKTLALGSRTMKRGIFQTLFGTGWVIGAVGCYVLSLGILFAVSLRFDAGALTIMGIGIALLIISVTAVLAGWRAHRSSKTRPASL
jgi:hypothetical protein